MQTQRRKRLIRTDCRRFLFVRSDQSMSQTDDEIEATDGEHGSREEHATRKCDSRVGRSFSGRNKLLSSVEKKCVYFASEK